jgi:hypothetical protein
MDIDERDERDECESNVLLVDTINEEQLMDIDADGSTGNDSENDSIDASDPANNDSRDNNTTSHPVRHIKKASKPTRTELRKTKWYRFNQGHLQKYKWLRYNKENDTAYCSYPLCKA